MKQLFEAILFFHFSLRIVPRFFDTQNCAKISKIGLYLAAFATLTAYQLSAFAIQKEPNLYEILGLESIYTSQDDIESAYQRVNERIASLDPSEAKQLHLNQTSSAHKCLSNSRCRDHYTRYNLEVDPSDTQNVETEYKIGYSILFYIFHSLMSVALSSSNMKPGIRMSVGLGIMFCIDELLIHKHVSAFIHSGVHQDKSMMLILSLFPQRYTVFELAVGVRIFYLLCFNIICVLSHEFVEDEAQTRIGKAQQMKRNQQKLYELTNSILEVSRGKQMLLEERVQSSDARAMRKEFQRETDSGVRQIRTGKTKEQLWRSDCCSMCCNVIGGMVLVFIVAANFHEQQGSSVLQAR